MKNNESEEKVKLFILNIDFNTEQKRVCNITIFFKSENLSNKSLSII